MPRIFFAKFLILILFLSFSSTAQDTFSICAVDPLTGQVGSAGATCIASASTSAIIISDVHPGVGVVHTQASYQAINQTRAKGYMNLGWTPQQIVDSVVANDWQNNPSVRQYGVVSLDSGGRSAAFTGINCMDYKNHITGPTYSIQGNILLGQQILDSMEAGFLNTNGTLACKLMAALQGARVIGADSRCAPNGISSYSAFLRVANPGDSVTNMYLDLTVNTYPNNIEPINELQNLFDFYGGCAASYIPSAPGKASLKYFPNPVDNLFHLESTGNIRSVEINDSRGISVGDIIFPSANKCEIDFSKYPDGLYFIHIEYSSGNNACIKVIKTI